MIWNLGFASNPVLVAVMGSKWARLLLFGLERSCSVVSYLGDLEIHGPLVVLVRTVGLRAADCSSCGTVVRFVAFRNCETVGACVLNRDISSAIGCASSLLLGT